MTKQHFCFTFENDATQDVRAKALAKPRQKPRNPQHLAGAKPQ
jgi:hypothetical protein